MASIFIISVMLVCVEMLSDARHQALAATTTLFKSNHDEAGSSLAVGSSSSFRGSQSTTRTKNPALSAYPVDCYSKPQSDLPFCDPKLPFMERAKDLESRLTLSEKIEQTSSIAPAIERFGIKDYNWRTNCLHGWTASGGHWLEGLAWTVFPAPIALGATFDTDLILKVAQVTADEGRALHNVMMDANNGSSTEAAGINCFSPMVNLFRDPRWGRGQETFGEDPYLISLIGAAYTHGLQEGEDDRYLKIAACAKAFAVHSGPEELRREFRANVTLHDLYDTYLPAFKTQVMGAKASQMMPAYSGIRCDYQPDGAPDAANPFLLKTVLREEFNAPNISVVSDNGAVSYAYTQQKYVSSAELAAAVCMNATTDLDLGHDEVYPNYLQKALNNDEVSLETIRDAVVRSFYLRMRLGDFDPPYNNSYNLIDKSHLGTTQNQELNLQAARKSIVLLKNSRYGLPLDPQKVQNIAVIGPNANATNTLLSNYEGIPFRIISVLQGIEEVFLGSNVTVNYASGCADVKCENKDSFSGALEIAKSADYVIMVMGLDQTVEAEGRDRVHVPCDGAAYDVLEPPGCQNALVQQVAELSSNIILVLINGGPVSLSQLYPSRAVIGIIEAFYPGALGGKAVADVLFGKYSPGGRMPVTTYVSSGELPPAVDYDMTTPPGRTYRYYERAPLIPFGYGLSYAYFYYDNMTVTPTRITACQSVTVTVAIENSQFSAMEGDEVILVYLVPPKRSDKPFFPNVQLVAFERVTLTPSQKYIAKFEINPYLQSLVDEDGEHYLFPGLYMLYSSHQPGDRDFLPVKGNFTITGDTPVKTSTCTSSPQCFTCT